LNCFDDKQDTTLLLNCWICFFACFGGIFVVEVDEYTVLVGYVACLVSWPAQCPIMLNVKLYQALF